MAYCLNPTLEARRRKVAGPLESCSVHFHYVVTHGGEEESREMND